MAVTNLARNLRDGQIVMKDGSSTPKTVTITVEEGNFTFTENFPTREILDRGALSHVRVGDEVPMTLSFSIKAMQVIGFTHTTADANQVYELVRNLESAYTSTRSTGERYCFDVEFTVTDPAGVASEKFVFEDCYDDSVTYSEGADNNTISLSMKCFRTKPTITRV